MPVFLDGQQNLAGLSVPGVYGDIILPTPFLAGTPTNIEGLVGVASWGPLNALIPISKPTDASYMIGPPLIRNYDVSSYVAAASQVGGAIGFYCVRVSDGTDAAATAAVQSTCITITAKYSGVLGNKIQFSIQNGSLQNSYMGVVAFPGMQPEQFNNVPGPVPGTGTLKMILNPTANDTIAIGGSTITFVSALTSGLQVLIGTTLQDTMTSLMTLLMSSSDSGLTKCIYSINAARDTITVTANQTITAALWAGTLGNAIVLAASNASSVVKSAATLTGGTGTWNTFWVNLANAINSGNAYHGISMFVVATAGVGTAAPIVSTPVTLTGGTDGATGVTDATLMGQDVSGARKGMYVLRNSNVDCFTLCDLTTIADYAAIISFAISETCLAIQGTVSGDTITNALATRINSGIDSPWMWLIMGDYPYFTDTYNQINRTINPSAFGIGICGNLSPQQSPLNKALQGVTATQRSALGQNYSDVEESLINLGGIDVILPASQGIGGFYFSFCSARNTSSNTAANGIEYTRMTNFLIRAAQSKAAGSFIGQLQSIQPNDQTRQNAKALFDGFSAQLASSETGLGINGAGMIDKPWLVVCDLTNNPPDLQARGYLFLYWQVRYLNVIRYFVVKFQGGGNVNVSVQSTVPSPSQFTTAVNVAA